jgi:hypothetical protein
MYVYSGKAVVKVYSSRRTARFTAAGSATCRLTTSFATTATGADLLPFTTAATGADLALLPLQQVQDPLPYD